MSFSALLMMLSLFTFGSAIYGTELSEREVQKDQYVHWTKQWKAYGHWMRSSTIRCHWELKRALGAECGWNSVDKPGRSSPGGSGNKFAEGMELCLSMGSGCNYMARSISGYMHLTRTCRGSEDSDWDVLEAVCETWAEDETQSALAMANVLPESGNWVVYGLALFGFGVTAYGAFAHYTKKAEI